MVLISNGHNKFFLSQTAVEAHRAGILDRLLTGGYPVDRVKRFIASTGLAKYSGVQRLLKREVRLPQSLVEVFWVSEVISQIGQVLRTLRGPVPISDRFLDYSLRLYSYQATALVARSQASIYHYRAGYGHRSVVLAKQKGMVALCDHSIAHPAVLEYLVENGGVLPGKNHSPSISRLWRNIQDDIDQADYVVVNSDFVKQTFVHQGWDPARVYVIYLGIDDEFAEYIPARIRDPHPSGPLKLMYAGDRGKRKGAALLVKALQGLTDIDWELVIAGNIDPSLKASHKSFFEDPRVTHLGYVSRAELATALSTVDVFVFPSLAEGSARVIFDALACGCYVITTPNSGSIVQDQVHGALVPPGDHSALRTAIRQSSEQRQRVARIGAQNAAVIKTHFTQADYGRNLLALYQSLIEKRTVAMY